MYLLDTNIWLERLLDQDQSAVVAQLLDALPTNQMVLSDFTLHSIGVILHRVGKRDVLPIFVQDVVIDGAVQVVSLPPPLLERVTQVSEQYNLDFDDAYQYVIAEQGEYRIVSFDRHFDQTPHGRQTPAQVLADLNTP